jgi:hypothetical protein
MERPQKPCIERELKRTPTGELVSDLTQESQIAWSNYIRELGIAERAMGMAVNDNDKEEGSIS